MKRINSNGIELLADSAGSGPSILFISGTGADLRLEGSVLNSPLASEYHLISYDQRGMGRSQKPDLPYSMLDYAKDAIAVMDAFDLSNVKLAGYSFGGMVAQEVAIRWPERVTQLALMATTAGGDGGQSYPIETLDQLPAVEAARKQLEVMDLGFNADWQAAHPEETNKLVNARVKANRRFQDEPGYKTGRHHQLAARAEHNTYDRLHDIQAPTIVIAGDRDGQASVDAQKSMAIRIQNCRFETVPGSHRMLSESDQVYRLMSEFFRC